jgi:hypothetical protein
VRLSLPSVKCLFAPFLADLSVSSCHQAKLLVRSSRRIAALRTTAALCVILPLSYLTGCSSGGSNSNNGGSGGNTVVTPSVVSISPAKLSAGVAATTLTVTGTNFTSTSAIQVGGVVEPTTYVSATQLTAAVPASQLASGGNLAIVVLNGSSTSASGTATTLEVDNPAPTITSFTPLSFVAGSASTTVSVIGTGFVPTSTVQLNGAARSTTYVSSTQVNVVLTSADLSAAASLSIAVVNAAPGGGTSSSSSVAVNNPLPTITSIAPTSVAVGATTPATITVVGTNFIAGTTIQIGSVAHSAAVKSSTQLTFTLVVSEQATAGKLAITAVNSAPGGGTSNAAQLTVAAPTLTPVITTVSPTSFVIGSPASSLAVGGSNFTPSSVVQWNGTALTTSYYNANNLGATVPANLLTAIGTATITVNSPSSLSPLSNSLTVSITNPPVPTITSISPGNGPINTAAKITIQGTGFTTNSTVSMNGTQLTATYTSSTSLTVSPSASALSLPGNYSFTVTTPAPGGGTSGSQVFTAYIPLVSNSRIYNPVDGLLYVSIPGSVGAPMGNSIVSVNPATGAIGTPIFVGSEPDKLAITADGHYLWVGLDGASAIRKVDLVAKTAGLQFSLPATNNGVYNAPSAPQALAALPGATDSVVVALSNTGPFSTIGLAIFDAGVQRPNTASATIYNNQVNAIQIDGSKNEIYAGSNTYATFTYNSTGLTQKATASVLTASSSQDEMQLLSGKIYTDFGTVYDAEAGALLGTLYLTGTTAAQGATLADSSLGKIFVADSTSGFYNGANQIQIFNLSDYTSSGTPIPLNASLNGSSFGSYGKRLTRWGANGLALYTSAAIFSLRSNSVADTSSTSADLGVILTAGGSTNTGGDTTFTAQVSNSGPSTATDVVLTAQAPSIGALVSATSTAGSCSSTNGITCSLGSIASGGSATVTFTVLQTTSGTSTMTVQTFGSTADANTGNNSATATATVTGANYNVQPVLSSISPSAIQTGASDTKLTVNGAGFSSATTVMLGSTALATSCVSSTQLTATVPAASLAQIGWAPVTVSTAAPGGGTSSQLPLTFYSVITIGVNHILYDPYSQQIMASVGSGSSTVTGNSIAVINPLTATVGTPVAIGSQPTNLALSSDGQILYTILSGSQSVARYNMLTGQADFTYAVPTNTSFAGGITLRGIAVQPGSENTIALDIASFTGNAIYDFDPVHKTAAIRGQASGPYSGSCIAFLDASNLLAFDTDTSGATLDHYTITSAGFTFRNYDQSTLNRFGCFKLSGGLAFANGGGIADPTTSPARQVATLPGGTGGGFSTAQSLAPDSSLQRVFYQAINPSAIYTSAGPDGFTAYDLTPYLPTVTVPLNMPAIEGGTGYTQVDMIRWGQDGLAILTSTGHIYLLRGAAIVPGLMTSGVSAATLGSVSSTTLATGSGNVMLTLTGSNFLPGVAVTWNGAYRTTTIVDATHVTVAIPASDLAAAGTGSLLATNPGASASNTLSVTVQ